MIKKEKLDELRIDLSIQSKNGIDFIFAASIIWCVLGFIWSTDIDPYFKSVYSFMVGAPLMPLALILSKIFKTNWKNKENPLQPLGIWFNVAQLFYFPFLVFILVKSPEYFIMTYAIITGAHFFPYAWFYKTNIYIFATLIIAVGALILGLYLPTENMNVIPFATSAALFITALLLVADFKKKIAK